MKNKWDEIFLAFSFMSFVSSTLIGCLISGYFAGKWVDGRFAVYPAGRIGGVVCGMVVAVWAIARHLKDNFVKHAKKRE
ncbi:MAG: hypothetical protein LBO03_06060 [Acidaminococcales bacterium]|nr:hypothetical protein [Acidaminococcales bacterium]